MITRRSIIIAMSLTLCLSLTAACDAPGSGASVTGAPAVSNHSVADMSSTAEPACEFGAVSAGSQETEPPGLGANEQVEVLLLMNHGAIDDKWYNQAAHEAVARYAAEHGMPYDYFTPAEASSHVYSDFIGTAIAGGGSAKVIAAPGVFIEQPVFDAQDLFPDVSFIMIDGVPQPGDFSTYRVGDNTVSVTFAVQEAGFLAGYAVVLDGYRNLGFIGGIATPPYPDHGENISYGYGFVCGAEAAAQDLGLPQGEVTIKYINTGKLAPDPKTQAIAAAWFHSGTEVIFAGAAAIGLSVIPAAEQAGGKMIGIDLDQSLFSQSIVTSAVKNIGKATCDMIDAFRAGAFPGGRSVEYSAAEDGVGLSMDTSRFTVFSQGDYDRVYARVASGEFDIPAYDSVGAVSEIPLNAVTILCPEDGFTVIDAP